MVAAVALIGIGESLGRYGTEIPESGVVTETEVTSSIAYARCCDPAALWVLSYSMAQSPIWLEAVDGVQLVETQVADSGSVLLPLQESDIQRLVCSEPFTLWRCEWAITTTFCESRHSSTIVGSGWYRGQLWYFYGLWQVASLIPPDDPNAPLYLLDPYLNTVEANLKYASGGPSHWPHCGYLVAS